MAQHRVKLSKKDWVEIYYALNSKALMVERGELGAEDTPGQDKEWIAHLKQIQKKIGSDGERAIACGVAPVE